MRSRRARERDGKKRTASSSSYYNHEYLGIEIVKDAEKEVRICFILTRILGGCTVSARTKPQIPWARTHTRTETHTRAHTIGNVSARD